MGNKTLEALGTRATYGSFALLNFFFFSELGVGGWEKKRSLAFSPHPKVLPPPPACHSFQLPPPPKWLLQRR